MRFRVWTQDNKDQPFKSYPAAVLRRSRWDDYNYKTTFSVTLFLSSDYSLKLEQIKIRNTKQGHGGTEMPDVEFDALGDSYCSLGQAYSYYESLLALGEDVYRPFLEGLRDMVLLPGVRERFQDEKGVQDSLLRFDPAVSALEDAPRLFDDDSDQLPPEALCFGYELPGKDSGVSTEFLFADSHELPSRLAVVIGYNGVGKTRLLADLAMLAYADETESRKAKFIARHGRYLDEPPRFGSIMAISYSAFDDFRIPGQGGTANDRIERSQAKEGRASARSYRYCGLRQVDKDGSASLSLKSIKQLTSEFHRARKRALEKDRVEPLRAAMEPVFREPSVETIADLPDVAAPHEEWRDSFARLSTGHKIVLNIVVQLCGYLERRSIVFIDEPELHLHPPLLAALLKSVGRALEEYDSFGIIATHSPVVLQEVPARNVKVLRRYPDTITIEEPEIETFAENVGILTTHAFDLDSKDTDYQGTIERLANQYDMDEIEGFFGGRLSSQARSLIMSVKMAEDKGRAGS
jgi:predicted ATPase